MPETFPLSDASARARRVEIVAVPHDDPRAALLRDVLDGELNQRYGSAEPEPPAVTAARAEALRVHVREELGVDPDEQPSPWTAAFSSLVCFSVGALVPLLTLLLGFDSLWLALAVGGLGLFVAGATVARFTNRKWWLSGGRQLLLGAAATAVTYLIGKLVGVPGGLG